MTMIYGLRERCERKLEELKKCVDGNVEREREREMEKWLQVNPYETELTEQF